MRGLLLLWVGALGCTRPAPEPTSAPDAATVDAGATDDAGALTDFTDDFTALDPRWAPIGAGAPESRAATEDGRLALSLDTMGTPARPLSVVGLRAGPFRVNDAVEIEWTLDWGEQPNGSYLEAAVHVAPSATDGDPETLPDALRVSHIGVPPGQNLRHEVARRRDGALRFIDRAGWPDAKVGRPPTPIRAKLELNQTGTVIHREGGRTLSRAETEPWKWPRVWVYFTLTSHSNYPKRTVYVDDVQVRAR